MRRFVVTGAPGAGKTTVLDALAARGRVVVREAATDVIAERQAVGVAEPWEEPDFLVRVVERQVAREAAAPDVPVLLLDRSPVCTLALARYAGRPAPAALVRAVDDAVTQALYERRVIVMAPLGFVTPTAARRITYEDSLRFDEVHRETYLGLGFELVVVPAVPVDERAHLVEQIVGR